MRLGATLFWPLASAGALTIGTVMLLGQLARPFAWLLVWLIMLSLVTFIVYGWDKRQAQQGRRRVPEVHLLLLGFLGGTVGALAAMRWFRHKTLKGSFQAAFWLLAFLQGLVLAGLGWHAARNP